ncbi:MAG: hypothetical protein ACM31C_25675 [Acidobacteriota bacterium]
MSPGVLPHSRIRSRHARDVCIRYLTCIQLARPIEAGDLPLLSPMPSEEPPRTFGQAKRDVVARFERAFFELMRKHRIDARRFRS